MWQFPQIRSPTKTEYKYIVSVEPKDINTS